MFHFFSSGRIKSATQAGFSHEVGMTLNDVEVFWIDAVTGEVHTPKITVIEGMNVLGYIEEMDDVGRINTRWAGDE